MRRLLSFFIPGGLILLVTVLLVRSQLFSEWLSPISRIYPYSVLVIGLFFGWRFHRTRLIYGTIVLFLVDRLLVQSPNVFKLIAATDSPVIFKAIAILLPLNLLVFSLMRTRGVLTVRGIVVLILIIAQLPVILLSHHYYPLLIEKSLDFVFYPVSFVTLPLSQPAMISFFLSAVLMVFYFFKEWDVMKHGFFWALVSVFLALTTSKPGMISTICFSTAGLILVISAIEAIYGMAYRDELTKLPARRALNEALLKLRGKYSIAMIDIDHFKKFNDRYGHDVGDQVLCMVASKLAAVAGGGKAFRYGGEEFTILFPGRSKENIISHLENVRKTVASASFKIRRKGRPAKKPVSGKKLLSAGQHVSVTVSMGVAEKTDKQEKPGKIVKMADKALYKAKKAGRNRIAT